MPTRDELGRAVREEWVDFARQMPDPKPAHLLPYDALSEEDKEVDRRIGVRLYAMGAQDTIDGVVSGRILL